jgi:hypothetical protein
VLLFGFFKKHNEKLCGFNIYDPADHLADKELTLLVLKEFAKTGFVSHWVVREHIGFVPLRLS